MGGTSPQFHYQSPHRLLTPYNTKYHAVRATTNYGSTLDLWLLFLYFCIFIEGAIISTHFATQKFMNFGSIYGEYPIISYPCSRSVATYFTVANHKGLSMQAQSLTEYRKAGGNRYSQSRGNHSCWPP